jgi:tetrahydromethanopterin S-methyltransferase subunit F
MDRDRSVTVLGMPDNEIDPAGNTQQFRAFVQGGPRDQATKSGANAGLIIGVAVAVVIVAVVVGFAVTMM